jgi:hypothetical protein
VAGGGGARAVAAAVPALTHADAASIDEDRARCQADAIGAGRGGQVAVKEMVGGRGVVRDGCTEAARRPTEGDGTRREQGVTEREPGPPGR